MRPSASRSTIRSPCDSNRLRARCSASCSSQLRSASASLWSAILRELLAHQAQPEAQGRERDAGEREQEAGADRESVGVVAGMLRPASGDEAIGAAERGGEDREGADRDRSATDGAARSGVCCSLIRKTRPMPIVFLSRFPDRCCSRPRATTMRRRPCKVLEAARVRARAMRTGLMKALRATISERGGGKPRVSAVGADDQGRGFARRKASSSGRKSGNRPGRLGER